MIFRVIIKVSYNEAYFDFDDALSACHFASKALEHSSTSEDCKKIAKISIEVVNPLIKEEKED